MNCIKNRSELINSLIKKNGYKSYLEIGLDDPNSNYNKIKCEHKVSVDPYVDDNGFEVGREVPSELTYMETSDVFFSHNTENFDIIFIDGLHTEEQAGRDIINSLKFLNKGGVVLCHDTLPYTEEMQIVPRIQVCWVGDVWKSISELYKQSIMYSTIDFETGVTIIDYNENAKYLDYLDKSKLNYSDFCSHRDYIMHVVPFCVFCKKYLL